MRRLPALFDTAALVGLIEKLKFTQDGTGILMANGQWQGIPQWAELNEAVQDFFRAFKNAEIPCIWDKDWHLAHVSLNTVLPGGKSGWHIDPQPTLPWDLDHFFRWHLPLVTNEECWFQEEDSFKLHMPKDHWSGPVHYWKRHRVWNDGETPRTHLILDLM